MDKVVEENIDDLGHIVVVYDNGEAVDGKTVAEDNAKEKYVDDHLIQHVENLKKENDSDARNSKRTAVTVLMGVIENPYE
jgi:hypothetical protein